jgi:hypothetical protein
MPFVEKAPVQLICLLSSRQHSKRGFSRNFFFQLPPKKRFKSLRNCCLCIRDTFFFRKCLTRLGSVWSTAIARAGMTVAKSLRKSLSSCALFSTRAVPINCQIMPDNSVWFAESFDQLPPPPFLRVLSGVSRDAFGNKSPAMSPEPFFSSKSLHNFYGGRK